MNPDFPTIQAGNYLSSVLVLLFSFFLCVEPRQRNEEPRHNHTIAIEFSFPLVKPIADAMKNRTDAI